MTVLPDSAPVANGDSWCEVLSLATFPCGELDARSDIGVVTHSDVSQTFQSHGFPSYMGASAEMGKTVAMESRI
jgi:hypothetical protein